MTKHTIREANTIVRLAALRHKMRMKRPRWKWNGGEVSTEQRVSTRAEKRGKSENGKKAS